jgi:hypothetical protein
VLWNCVDSIYLCLSPFPALEKEENKKKGDKVGNMEEEKKAKEGMGKEHKKWEKR